MANLFTIPHWFKRENTWRKRLCTLPLFLGQFWPQYQVLKVFWMIKNKDLRWRKKKEQLDREIGSIEPFLESLPQVHILLCILFLGKDQTLDTRNWDVRLSFALSVMSAAFGITKFLKVGPCRLLPYGRMSFGLFLVLLNIAACLVGKGVSMFTIDFGRNRTRIFRPSDGSVVIVSESSKPTLQSLYVVLAWICINILPQMLFAFILIWKTAGLKKTIEMIINFPALILTPAFSFWIIGPYGKLHRTSNQLDSSKKFLVSYFHSWINVALTVGGSIITWSVVSNITKKEYEELDVNQLLVGNITKKQDDDEELDVNQLLISLPLLAFSILLFFLIQYIDHWKCCSILQPVTQRTLYSIENPTLVIDLKDQHELEQTEMVNNSAKEIDEPEKLSSVCVIDSYDFPF
jgi:hypothetical protein